MIAITVRTTHRNAGGRRFRTRTYDRVEAVELDFIPGEGDRPTQARIWHQVWEPRVGRHCVHVSLVVQDDLPELDQLPVVVRR